MFCRIFAFLCLMTIAGASLAQAENATSVKINKDSVEACSLKIDEDSVKAYTCENKDSKFRTVKVLFEASASAEQLASMLWDIQGYNSWQYKTINASVLKYINDNELIYYAEFDIPWPISNRDVIVHMKIERDGGNMKVSYKGIPDYLPEKEDIVRAVSSASSIEVVTVEPGRIQVEFKSNADPGGNLPAFIMNQVAVDGPFESFSELRRRLNELRK